MASLPTVNQVVTLTFNNATSATFTPLIHVNIDHPDGFFVRQLAFTDYSRCITIDQTTGQSVLIPALPNTISYPSTIPVMRTLYSTLVNNTIGTLISGTTATPNTYFRLTDNVHGNYTFRFDDIISSPTTALGGVSSVVLEFVKYS